MMRRAGGALLIAALAGSVSTALGAQPKLLEPERAFALSVQAIDERTVEARFSIAPGYYLYREKLRFSVEPGAVAGAPSFPAGIVKDDEFFGRVETYRGRLAIRLPLEGVSPGASVIVHAESQGCADAGVCYPPQAQKVAVPMPLPGARPGPAVAATPPKKSWFN